MSKCAFDTPDCLVICKYCVYKHDDQQIISITENAIKIIRELMFVKYSTFHSVSIYTSSFVRTYLAYLLNRIAVVRLYINKYSTELCHQEYISITDPPAHKTHNLLNLLKSISLTLLAICHSVV